MRHSPRPLPLRPSPCAPPQPPPSLTLPSPRPPPPATPTGRPLSSFRRHFWTIYPGVQLRGWRFWPLVSLVQYLYVPLELRALGMSLAGLGWSTYIVLASRSLQRTASVMGGLPPPPAAAAGEAGEALAPAGAMKAGGSGGGAAGTAGGEKVGAARRKRSAEAQLAEAAREEAEE